MNRFQGSDIPLVSPLKFEPSDSIFFKHMAPVVTLTNGIVTVDKEWTLLGVCERLSNSMDKDGHACLLLWNEAEGTVWQHYPASGYACLEWEGKLIQRRQPNERNQSV